MNLPPIKWKSIFGSSLIPLNAILLIFLLFESRLVVPPWLQMFGRLHPMVLHFPIVLIIGYALWEGVMARRVGALTPMSDHHMPRPDQVAEALLLAAAFTASITAIMGLLLSAEPAYEGASLGWHKWLGALTSFGLLAAWSFRGSLRTRPNVTRVMAGCLMLLVLVAGHLGGTITHGENFVLRAGFPQQGATRATLDKALVFTELVEPILESKCRQCHSSGNAKGGLSMDSEESLLKGGKDGKLWDTADISLGLLLIRVHLRP